MTKASNLQFIAIHGAPRSGTTWLGQLFNSSEHVAYRYQPMFSYAFKGRLDDCASAAEIGRFFDDLLETEDDFVLQRRSASLSGYSLEFPKAEITHLVYKEVRYHQLLENLLKKCPRLRLVALVRDPRAIVQSWLNAPREFDPSWRAIDEWQFGQSKNEGRPENWYGFERWKELARVFLRLQTRYPSRVDIIRYESLTSAPLRILASLFDSCGLPMTQQVEEFVPASQERDDGEPYGVFRSSRQTIVKWRESLDPRIIETILNGLEGTELQQFLFDDVSTRA